LPAVPEDPTVAPTHSADGGHAGRLQLAVRLVGAHLAGAHLVGAHLVARPSRPFEHLVEQLRDEHRRLEELRCHQSGVRVSIAGSVQFLASSHNELDRHPRACATVDH
jgi:hypothetical protein